MVGAAVILAAGCASVPEQTSFMEQSEQIETTAWELRLRVYDLGTDMAAEIERTADGIIADTDSPEVARNALMWKANAIPVLYRAVFQPDPLAALIEITVFSVQVERFFADGAGRDVFGPHQSRAVTVSRQLRQQSVDLARQVTNSSELPDAREVAQSWAEAHPIDDLSFTRRSTVALWAEQVGADPQGGMAMVASIDESFQDLLERLKIYAAEMPKQARWQAQLATADLMANEDVRLFLGDVESIEAEIDTIAQRFDDFVLMVDAMYAEAWQQISVERVAAMADVDAQRVATLDQLAREREIVLAALASEREVILAEFDTRSGSMLNDSEALATRLIDHLIWRLGQLLVVLLVIGAAAVWVVLRYGRRRTPGSSA